MNLFSRLQDWIAALSDALGSFASRLPDWMAAFAGFVWSTPTALLLTGAGVVFTIMTLGIQWRALTHGIAVIRGKYDNPEDEGNISHFQALCAALSATIGLGNIAGVAVAVAAGGAGAIFWMWVVGLLGMATKFTTCSLATMYRKRDRFGEYRGGPMYYIEMGLARQNTLPGVKALAKFLAISFAILGMCASLGAGNMFQANQVARISVNLVQTLSPAGIGATAQWWMQISIGVALAVLAGLVIIGGIKRIGNVASRLVPTMCVLYVAAALYVILANITLVPDMFEQIFVGAFTPQAGTGAFLGVAVKVAMIQGVRRACFSNEAGLGSAPMAHATAKTDEPIREGIVAAMGPFIDTVIVCTMTALVILITGTLSRAPVGEVVSVTPAADPAMQRVEIRWTSDEPAKEGEKLFVKAPTAEEGVAEKRVFHVDGVADDGARVRARLELDAAAYKQDAGAFAPGSEVYLDVEGVNLTAYAFDRGFGTVAFGTYFIPIAAFFFAFSTIISWSYYGETCTEYLFGESAVLPYKALYCAVIVIGTLSLQLDPVLDWADGMLGLMLVPNLIGTLLLAPTVMRATHDYFRRLKAGEFDAERRR